LREQCLEDVNCWQETLKAMFRQRQHCESFAFCLLGTTIAAEGIGPPLEKGDPTFDALCSLIK
jgi:hypothetical protein